MFENYPDVVGPQEVQEMLHIGRTKTYSLLRSGKLRHRRIDGRYFIRKIDIIEFIQPLN